MIVILLGKSTDQQLCYLAELLKLRGAISHIVDIASYPTKTKICWHPKDAEGEISSADFKVKFDQIYAVFWQSTDPPECHNHADTLATQSCLSMLLVFYWQEKIKWFNSIDAVSYHRAKPLQLHHAALIGAQIPATYTGSNAKHIERILSTNESVICKPIAGGRYTKLVDASSAISIRDQQVPATYQAYVEGTNLRTYVVGRRTFSACIHTSHVDFRTDPHATVEVWNEPADFSQLATEICQQFGMRWCAIDWRLTPDGRVYFLEANPCPRFLEFEQASGLPIGDALADLITGRPDKPLTE